MLRISKLTDYATVILASLATQPQKLHTAADVAERTHIGLPTVRKLLKTLHHGGLVTSTRGSLGGYQLQRPAQDISAADILDALEGPFAITECSGQHNACDIASTCRVGHSWQRINAAIRRTLCDLSLAQLAGLERGTIRSLNFGAGQPVPLTRATRAPSD
jgi:FeS assembly SUF system regulator